MTNNAQETKVPDKKEWLRDLASGDALYYLANDLASSFFKDARDPKCWSAEINASIRQLVCRSHLRDIPLPCEPDAFCHAGDVYVWLVMDTDQEPDLSKSSIYSEALTARYPQKRTLLVYITEHSCLEENRWSKEIKTYANFPADEKNNEEGIHEWLPTWPNFMIIDLENFQKQVPAPEGFFQEFLKILAESRTLGEARKALDAATKKQEQDILDELAYAKAEIARLKEELANKDKARQTS
ncbi:hypothetical protein [Succinimonas sp.]|uniref:hypothetical protein n=1 Tax=Succinimonas sp. TaxID=1936151 RepID=UPI003868CE15